ncbi:acyl--CoA ligase [Myxococcota bacterium]|nr:acyl--CoA ligase [Myxococcota bacterium]
MRNDSRKMTRSEALAHLTGAQQRFELETIQQYGESYRAFKNAPSTLRDLYQDNRSEKPFIVFGDERLSFEEAWQASSRIGYLLTEHYGVRKGDRVAISMRNYPEWILSFTATTSIGAIAVAMNSLWQPDELAYGLSDSGARVLLADDERLQRLAQAETDFPDLSVLGVRTFEDYGLNMRPLSEALQGIPATVPMPEVDLLPEDDATIFYTSGSTGHPKGVVSAHRSVLTALLSWELDIVAGAVMDGRESAPPTIQPATLLGVPLFHATGSHAVYLASYRAQRRLVCMYKWDPGEAADLIEREQISNFVAPAAMTGDLGSAAERTGRDLGSLLVVGGGGAPRAPAQVKSIDRTFRRAQPNTGWGMTETNAI